MPAAKSRLAPLTSIRFFAALRVALFHFVSWEDQTFWWRGLMATPISVSYFFVSSGFLLAYNYSERVDRRQMNYRNFFLGRCARLLPVYFLGLLVALPLLFLPVSTFSSGKSTLTVLLVQAWSPQSALYWNSPAWALSNLAFFYVSLPILLTLTRSSSKRACFVLATLAWVTSLALSLIYLRWNPDGLHHINSESVAFWLYILKYHPLVRLPEFFMGVMAGRLFLLTGGFSQNKATVVFFSSGALLLAALLLGYRVPYPVINSGLLAPLLVLIVASLASGGFGARLFRHKWLVFLGQSSFCLYMLHLPIWKFFHEVLAPHRVFSHGMNLIVLAGIVGFALLMYRWVEMPATAALRKFLVASSATAPAAVVPVLSTESD